MVNPKDLLLVSDPVTNLQVQVPRDQLVFLKFPVHPRSRFGHGMPPHPQLYEAINASRQTMSDNLRRFATYRDCFSRIAPKALPSLAAHEPAWENGYFEALDAASVYCFLAERKPRRFFEIGGGNSTKFARRAILDHGLPTQIISVDPEPRAEVDKLCDRVIRTTLEDADLSIFSELETGDVLFLDGSHYTFMNSDATVFFLEILPRIPSGVLVHVHDIFLPADYPVVPYNLAHFYSEQYLLAAYLLGGNRCSNIQMACQFVQQDPELATPAQGLGDFREERGLGTSFWWLSA